MLVAAAIAGDARVLGGSRVGSGEAHASPVPIADLSAATES